VAKSSLSLKKPEWLLVSGGNLQGTTSLPQMLEIKKSRDTRQIPKGWRDEKIELLVDKCLCFVALSWSLYVHSYKRSHPFNTSKSLWIISHCTHFRDD
jgi:hypothetical protein